jgi:hypothetical protein
MASLLENRREALARMVLAMRVRTRRRQVLEEELSRITRQLLEQAVTAPPPPVPEHPEDDEHELRYFQK